MTWFMGLDASTQSLSSAIIDLATGCVVREDSVSFGTDLPEYRCAQGFLAAADPLVKHADPLLWAAALDRLFERLCAADVDLGRIKAVSGSGQQHGTVYLTGDFATPARWQTAGGLAERVKPLLSRATAPIWMDSSTSRECREITEAAGGAAVVRRVTGSPAIERFSGPQIRKFARQDPAGYARTGIIHLVSSFMGSLLAGRSVPIDLGDGAGMNLMSVAEGAWDSGMLAATAPDLDRRLPPLVTPDTSVGEVAPYFVERYGFAPGTPVVAWSGDNPNSLIGVGCWQPGTAVVSLGTSDTYFAAMPEPHVDPAGYGHVFGNPAGGFMSLICFKNGALAREAVREAYALDWAGFERWLRATPTGNHGNLMLPYFVPEITPLVLDAQPRYHGIRAFVDGSDGAGRVRAVVEAQALRLRLHSAWIATPPTTLRVTGGGSANTAICQILADVFAARVERLETTNSAALGAALRAAHAVGAAGWAELTAMFCRSAADTAVTPVERHVAVYEAMLPEYAAFAGACADS